MQFKPGDQVTHRLAGGRGVFDGVGTVLSVQPPRAKFPSGIVSNQSDYWTKVGPLAVVLPEDGFERLRKVYAAAVEQTKSGKGADRHGSGEAFEKQLIVTIGEHLGSNHFELGQAIKKLIESSRLAARGEVDKARSELLGALNYTAAAYLMLESK